MKIKKLIIMVPLLLSLMACGAATSSSSSVSYNSGSTSSSVTSTTVVSSTSVEYEDEYDDVEYKESETTKIVLQDTTATITGSGAAVVDSTVTIFAAGTYLVSGSLSDGQIIVLSTDKTNPVHIILSGASITCSDSSPLYIQKAKGQVIVTLEEGTTSTLTDGSTYTLNADEEPTATIFSKDDLIFNGSGKLVINSNYNDAIKSNDSLYIMGGTYVINSVDDGIIGKDLVAITAGTFTITAGGDGIKATNDSDEGSGIVNIEGGTFNITATADGIQGESLIQISAGDFTIKTGGGATNSSSNSGWGSWGGTTTTASTDSAKGVKAQGHVLVTGGTFNMNTSDDAFHCNGSMQIDAGTITIASGDDGMHADTDLVINGGTINITKSYEGIEGNTVTVNGGNISLVASDDGFNCAGGNDSSSSTGRPGANTFNTSSTALLSFNGGTVYVNASGDGLDSNGSIVMTGGTVYVSGPTNGGNGALDYDGTFNMTGGTVLAAGAVGMVQTPSTSSTVYGFNLTFTSTQSAGKEITIKDSSGNTLISYTPDKAYQSLVLSSALFSKGSTYSVYVGGTKYTDITLTSIVTTSGSSSGSSGGMMPGGR